MILGNRGWRKFVSILLGIVFLQYFASTNFFIHCHKLPTRIIVHSHPFPNKPHNHTDNQINCIDLLSEATCETTPLVNAPEFMADIVRDVSTERQEAEGQRTVAGEIRLRAPPIC